VAFRERWQEIRTGFTPAFWVANTSELFERLAYYGPQAVLAIYLTEHLRFSPEDAGQLIGFYGFAVWFLPIIGGALADRFGFRRTLAAAYLILGFGYFLLGSLSAPWMAGLREAVPLYWLVLAVMMVPALGPAVVKPVVAGTTARGSADQLRTLGYSIYYTIVNVGGTLGPLMAFRVRTTLGVEAVFRVSALFSLAMFVFILLTYREPPRPEGEQVRSIGASFKNLVVVLGNGRFVAFLVIFSGFYVMLWQQYVSVPLYVRGYVSRDANVDLLLTASPATVIATTFLVNYLTRRVRPFAGMTAGMLIAGLAWLLLAFGGSQLAVVLTLIAFALGEVTLSPRFYDYCSRLAPKGQEGLFMGYAFLPVAIGYFIAGPLGGWLVQYFGEELRRPQQMWFVVVGIGLLTTGLMVLYDRVVKPGSSPKTTA